MTTIRRLAPGDVSRCVDLGLEALGPVFLSMEQRYGKDLFDRLHPDWETAQSELVESFCTGGDRQSWVAVTDGSISGFIVVKSDDQTGLGDVDIVAVSPEVQRNGVRASLHEGLPGSRCSSDLVREGWFRVDAGLADAVLHEAHQDGDFA